MPDQGYPPAGFYFSLSFEAIRTGADAAFQEVSGLNAERATETIGQGGQNLYKYQVPGVAKYTNLVLRRGLLMEGSALSAWVRSTIGSDLTDPIVPKQVFLSLLNPDGSPLIVWTFEQAWPVKWSLSDFKAEENVLAIETLELAYTRFQQQKAR